MKISRKLNAPRNESLEALPFGRSIGLSRASFRPSDRPAFRVAALELAERGLQPWDVAAALGVTVGAVRDLLAGGDLP